MFWLEKWAAAAAQEEKSTGTGKPRKSLPVLPLPSCLSAVCGLSEPKARALEINPSSKNLSNLFWNHLYSDLSTLLWQGLPQSSYAFVKKIFLEFNCCQLISVCSLISASLHLPEPYFIDLHHSPSKSPGQTLSREKMI